jgi:ribosomal protein S4
VSEVGFLLAFLKRAHELMGVLLLTTYKVLADKLESVVYEEQFYDSA